MKKKIIGWVIVILATGPLAKAKSINKSCRAAHIKSFFVDKKLVKTRTNDLCLVADQVLPADARVFINQIKDANEKIINSLGLSEVSPFFNELSVRLVPSDLSVIDSAFEIVDGTPQVRLGTTKNHYFERFSQFVYTHEMGHWYISYYLPTVEKVASLKNIATFQEFFADALVIDIYGNLDTSDIEAPLCIRQIRTVGEHQTFKGEIGKYDTSSYFREAAACCRSLAKKGEETSLSQAACKHNKEIETIFFPDGLPKYSRAPLDQNVHSLYLSEYDKRLEPHKASTPINSFLIELSKKTKKSIMSLLLPTLKKNIRSQTAYQCSFEEILDQSVFDVVEEIDVPTIDSLFLEIRDQVSTEHTGVFDSLFRKYGMHTAQVILRNEEIDIAKFSIQERLKNKTHEVWKTGQAFLQNWHCIDQQSGQLSQECDLDIICEPQDASLSLRREFIRRDNGVVYTPVVKFIHEVSNKEVVFVGLNHSGPTHYFNSLDKLLSRWIDTSNNYFLREFFTCDKDGQTLTTNRNQINQSDSNYLSAHLINYYHPYLFFQEEDSHLTPLLKTYQFYKKNCVRDIDGRTLRPFEIVERNRNSCAQAESKSLSCQWKTIEKRLSAAANSKEGDVILNRSSDAVQIAAVNMYRGLPTAGNLDLWVQLLVPTNHVLYNFREKTLIENVVSSFDKNIDRIILPWGVGHVQAIKELLYLEGFYQFEVEEVPYASMEDYGLDTGIDSMLTIDFEYIGENYNF